jgi:hypothetical protein
VAAQRQPHLWRAGSTYKLKTADKGKRSSVRVTGSKTGYVGDTRTSAETKKIKKKKRKH